jgi:hypothetical protein
MCSGALPTVVAPGQHVFPVTDLTPFVSRQDPGVGDSAAPSKVDLYGCLIDKRSEASDRANRVNLRRVTAEGPHHVANLPTLRIGVEDGNLTRRLLALKYDEDHATIGFVSMY